MKNRNKKWQKQFVTFNRIINDDEIPNELHTFITLNMDHTEYVGFELTIISK